MIWEMALPGPRIVHLVGFQIPALLHVNWEAKQVVEKHYKRCFEPQLEYYIYFSFAQDALFLERSRHLGILTGSNDQQDFSEFYSNLQNLVIGPDWDWERPGGYGGGDQRQWLFEHITKFERLDSIIQIINQVCPYRFKFMADLETEQFNRNWKELVPEYTMPLFANKTEHEVYREMTGYFVSYVDSKLNEISTNLYGNYRSDGPNVGSRHREIAWSITSAHLAGVTSNTRKIESSY